eukprot:5169663-Pleurochrysis_carterae.AAC.1
MLKTSESPMAADTSDKTAWEGVGPAGPTTDVAREGVGPVGPIPDPDREGVAPDLPTVSDGVILEGSQPKPPADDSVPLDVAQPFTGRQ